MDRRHVRAYLTALAVVAAVPASASAATGVPGRDSDPIVIKGADVPVLLGSQPGRVVAFSYDGGWHQVPVQVDERKLVDYAAVRQGHQTSGRPFSNLAYADPGTFAGADPDPSLDADDEIAAMAMDAGDGVNSGGADPSGVEPGTRSELRIADAVDPGPARFIYLFRSSGELDPSAGRDYVTYDFKPLSGDYKTTYDFSGVPGGDNTQSGPPGNPENSSVSTDYYLAHQGARWITDGLGIRVGGATGVDVLDGDKAQVSYGCGRSELTFSRGGGGFIANIDGPVRAIRSYIGSNSGTYTQHDTIYYQRSQVDTTYLRVHPGIATISQFLDYSAAANGMTYRNSASPGGVTIDGTPDPSVETGTTPGPAFTWEQATGAQGTLSIVARLATDMPGIQVGSYYEDTATPAAQQCVGYADNRTYGASGLVLTSAGQNTDPTRAAEFGGTLYSLTSSRTVFFSGPGGDAALGAKRAAQVDSPLQVALGGGDGDGGQPRLRIRAHGRKGVEPGERTRIKVKLKNAGSADAAGVKVCLKAPRKQARTGGCKRIRMLAAGERRKVKLAVRLRRGARRDFRVRVKATAQNAGRSVHRTRIKLK